MSNTTFNGEFIKQAEAVILDNISDEQFGVSELADIMNMSRSSLLRKIKKQTELSASQFIRQIRLQKSMDLLKTTSLNVSEISYQVGFGSTSYFIKCFREHYGHPPGEIGKGILKTEDIQISFWKQHLQKIITGVSLVIIVASFFYFNKTAVDSEVNQAEIEKSIAVLPFKNESNDSSNLYFVNGLMESSLKNLQKIEDLRVVSRTSVEKYRDAKMNIPEIAEELNVNYLVEGSGQRIGDQVLLNIQLIETSSDTPVWVEQYSHKLIDIFELQNEVAKKIADAIEATITPSELEQIDKKPTESLIAYDYYLQALDPFYTRTRDGLKEAIPLFEKALDHDPQFALAYANIAISYYHLDIFQKKKQYTDLINNNADKALLYDAKSDISLIAKALFYMHNDEYRLALPHLEKALEYNPNSSDVVQLLGLFYARITPDTAKYLKYALKGIQLDIAANDSVTKSFIYLTLSNALIQTGFVDEAMKYIDKSLNFDPDNYYAPYVKAFIVYAKDRDIDRTKQALIRELNKDTTRLDILQEVAKMHYFQEDYEGAFVYYQKFVNAKKKNNLVMFPEEDIKIGMVYKKMGLDEEASNFFKAYAEYCENDQSIYKAASTAVKYVYEGKLDLAIEQFNIFATQDNYQYWVPLFIEKDPLIKPLKNHPEYEKTMQKIKDRFWENQAQLKKYLVDNGLL